MMELMELLGLVADGEMEGHAQQWHEGTKQDGEIYSTRSQQDDRLTQ